VLWDRWREIADRVFVRRHRTLDLNIGLVLGDERCLVVDTRGSDREARELLRAVRSITPLPITVANTHAHFDHCFGNATFYAEQPGCEIWGHELCRQNLLEHGELQQRQMVQWLRDSGEQQFAADVEQVVVAGPNRTFTDEQALDLGGRDVLLHHPGLGHSDHDVVVEVEDTDVTFVGDLVEQGAPPSFDDAFPLDWPGTLDGLLKRLGAVVVPGHGEVVDPEFVRQQREDIAEVGAVAKELPWDVEESALEWAANRLAVGGPAGYLALQRAQEHLAALALPPTG
jgi:glyoxylase-like metal-dependent hydrolase (beta-lactamase superfamily II)